MSSVFATERKLAFENYFMFLSRADMAEQSNYSSNFSIVDVLNIYK